MTKSANSTNRELIDYVQSGLRLVPDSETLDRIDANNGLRSHPGLRQVERGIMRVTFETLVFVKQYGAMARKTYELVNGPRLILVGTELDRHV